MSDMLDTINSALLGIDGQAHQPDSAVIADLATLIVLVARADQDVKRIVDWAKLASIAPQTIFTRCSRGYHRQTGARPRTPVAHLRPG